MGFSLYDESMKMEEDTLTETTKRQQVARVLVITLFLNLAVAVGKIVIGTVSGTLAVTADGFHSLLDGTSNIVALVANHMAARPPDSEHPYGHRRFETLAALFIGILMTLMAWEVGRGALGQLDGVDEIDLTPLVFVVLLATAVINAAVTRYQTAQGHRLHSELLLADAQHTRSDLYVTGSVIISSGLVLVTGWVWIDRAIALVVVILIIRVAWRILWETGSVLVDTAPYTPEQLAGLVDDVPGASGILRARSRGSQSNPSVDIDVQVSAHMTTAQTAAITDAIRERLEVGLGQVGEIEVHFVPEQLEEVDYALIARAEADRIGLSTHEVSTAVVNGVNMLELHVEVPADQTLQGAHEQVTQLEQALIEQLPEIDEVVTHIEPLQGISDEGVLASDSMDTILRRRVLDLLGQHFPYVGWHHARISQQGDAATLFIHAALKPDTSVEDAHALAERAEILIRAQLPRFTRVTIHTEPLEAAG